MGHDNIRSLFGSLLIRCFSAFREIYDWDDDTGLQGVGGGGLAGKLDESLDAFNDDTFGMPEQAEVGECELVGTVVARTSRSPRCSRQGL